MANPADMLEQAKDLFERRDELEQPPPWVQDQNDAAAAELKPVLDALARELGNVKSSDATPETVAFGLAVMESVVRRRKDQFCCPHSKTQTPPPLIVDLNQGMVACRVCAAAMDLPLNEDERCDLCDRPTKIFVEFWYPLGPSLVHGDLCESCKEWL